MHAQDVDVQMKKTKTMLYHQTFLLKSFSDSLGKGKG